MLMMPFSEIYIYILAFNISGFSRLEFRAFKYIDLVAPTASGFCR